MKVISLLFILVACASYRPKESEESIRKVLLSRYEDYRVCLLKSGQSKAQPEREKFTVMLNVIIHPNGTVKETQITNSDFEDKKIHSCFLAEIRSLKFPVMDKEYSVKQTFHFHPEKKK